MQVQENCVICQIGMKRKALISLLPCGHLLHQACSVEIIANGLCPICRGRLTGTKNYERKKNQTYLPMDRARIVESANRGEDWTVLASTLNVKYKTAFSWINSGRSTEAKRGGFKPKSLSDEEVDVVIGWIEENSTVTLKEIASKLQEQFRKRVCVSTISNYLDGRLFTTKSVHRQPVTMNSAENKRKRAEYVTALNALVRSGKQILYMDETNFNLFCRRSRGRSRAGTRAVQTLPTSRGPNIHLIGAIATSGIVALDRRRGSFRANNANEWIVTVLDKWIEMGNFMADLVIVCDNAPCHAKLEEAVNGYSQNQRATILRLGPYSPMLNPIEIIWSKIKNHVKINMRIPQTNGPGVGEQRLVFLENLIDEAKLTITGGDCGRAIQHTTTFFTDALSMCDMPVGA